MFLLIFMDTDQNAATGDPDTFGADYVIQMIPGAAGLFQWQPRRTTTSARLRSRR